EGKPQSPEAAPLEHGERLQFNPLYPPKAPSLPPRLSVPLLRIQEEPPSHAEGKSEEESWGDGRSIPLPSQPGLSAIAAVPLCGGTARRLFSSPAVVAKEAPPLGTLTPATIQSSASCSGLPLSQVSVQEPCGKGYRRLHPPPPSVHLQATMCVARELGERERKRGRRREREKVGEREMKEKGRKRERVKEKEREKEREKGDERKREKERDEKEGERKRKGERRRKRDRER
ncbi:hypothetical protein E2320_019888, partial [Naja naja]